MSKEEIIKLYISDLKNIVGDSPAQRSRILMLEMELEKIKNPTITITFKFNGYVRLLE